MSDASTAPTTPPPAQDDRPRTRGGWTAPPVLIMAVVAVLALIAGVVFLLVPRSSATDSSAGADIAVVDNRASAEVQGQVDTILQQIFTFSSTDLSSSANTARQSLVSPASGQYQQLLAGLKQRAAGQQLTVRTTVQQAGVKSLIGDHAQLLIFVEQTSTRVSDGATATSGATLSVVAVKRDGVWKISDLSTL